MSLIDRITFPLAARGPFLPVDTSGATPGTYQEAVDAGGLDRSGTSRRQGHAGRGGTRRRGSPSLGH